MFYNKNTRQLAGMKILVVDDDPVQRRIASGIVSIHGADVHEAVDGLDAIDKTMQQDFDVIFMDIYMPRINGFEAARAIKGSRFKGTLVALTGVPGVKVVKAAMSAGFDECLSKTYKDPFPQTTWDDLSVMERKIVGTAETYKPSRLH